MLSLPGVKASWLLAVFSAAVVVSFPQSDWVWGKQQGSASSPSSFSQTAPAASISRPSSSFFGTGSSSNIGNVADNVIVTSSQSSGSNKPTVIVQVLQPGSSAVNGLTSTGFNLNSTTSSVASTRGAPAEGEGRIFPGVGRFVSQAINQFVNNNFANNGFLNTLLNLGNRFPTTSRPPTGGSSSNNNNNNNNDEFNTSGGGTGSSNNNNFGNTGSGSQFLGQSCRCIPASSCRLPSVDKGNCAGGIMCCRERTRGVGSTGTSSNTRTPSTRFSPGEVRLGLFEDIVRGSGNVVDNAIDFLFAPYLTQEDQQRLATRIGSGGTRQG